MMKSVFLFLSLLLSTAAFAPTFQHARATALKLAVLPPPLETTVAFVQHPTVASQQSVVMQDGIKNYMASPSIESSTMSLSLKDRPPPPTAEELAAKKANFNFWFWGGGFVAPFVATVYYFGPKFWKY